MKLTMPGVLEWVLGGNIGNIENARTSQCLLGDKSKVRGGGLEPSLPAAAPSFSHFCPRPRPPSPSRHPPDL